MKKKMACATEEKKKALAQQQQLIDKERRDDDRTELMETETSKKLALAMLKSAQDNSSDTLQKAVELLHNQNGNYLLFKYVPFNVNFKNSLLSFLFHNYSTWARTFTHGCV